MKNSANRESDTRGDHAPPAPRYAKVA